MMENEPKLAQVFHFDLQGKREYKYDFLNQNTLSSIQWNDLQPTEPNFFLVKKDFENINENDFFQIEKLFGLQNSGLTTEFDELAIQDSLEGSKELLLSLKTKNSTEIESIYKLGQNKLDKISNAIKDICDNRATIKSIYYRPFDQKYTIYTGKTNGIMGRPRNDLMKHFSNENLGLIIGRQGQAVGSMPWNVLTITNTIVDCNIFYRGRGTVFPLYLYPEQKAQLNFGENTERTPNLNPEIIKQIADGLGLVFTNEKEKNVGKFAPIDVLDYIYAVLHSPSYREKYKEFLKIDFPRVPYPRDLTTFQKLSNLGSQIRQIHLLESDIVEEYITQYPEDGDDVVGKIKYEDGRVYINENQYFDSVPSTAWNFYIGGYQPAQKWLKDRKERVLSFEDILHYQKIIVALTETARLMTEIDFVGVE
jgi:predicted helicase